MTKSLARKLAFVALSSMMVLGACQTGSIQTAEQKVGEGEEAYWYNPYYGADRRPANDIKMLVSILNECSPKQKLEYLEFLSKSTAKELGEFGVVYRFATKGGRQIVESDMDNFVKVLEKIDEKAQNKIFIEEVANDPFLDTSATAQHATEIQAPAAPVDLNTRVGQYVKLRDLKTQLKDKHKAELAPIDEAMEQLEQVLLGALNAQNANSVKTASGTVYKSVKESASMADPAAFWSYVIASGNFDLIDKKANVTAVKAHIEDPANNGQPPPGINFSSVALPRVRRG